MADRTAEYARKLLVTKMRDLSEDYWCAGWLVGLEFDLWKIVLDSGGPFGMGHVSPAEAAELKQLAEDAGGWCTHDNFMPMEEWLPYYERYKGNPKRILEISLESLSQRDY